MPQDSQRTDSAPDITQSPLHLHSDCENCFGLCCVSLAFAASIDFAIDKAAGTPCRNLQDDYRCGIHGKLRQQGFRGCTVFECFGAGQHVSQVTFGGRDWRQAPETAKPMFEVFPVMRQLHELLWYLASALTLQTTQPLHHALHQLFHETERCVHLPADALMELDVAAHRAKVSDLLFETSELVRSEARKQDRNPPRSRKAYGRGADLVGAKLRGADLRYANLRGAYLIAADLREANLRFADLIGADLRDTDLRGADLTNCLFLTQAQLNAAQGDAHTKLPPAFVRPAHWSAANK
ncbi:pentapeptide repeat-containing protein [Paenibacillus chartarius]|uniref:Pentapeptide repeat-containing protein n=1 Tax=Paenibacillus chartarius TaxID=747481 RepID=A0ABV6DSE4_9BACL